METCPPRDEWVRRLDGEVTANRAAELALHVASCGSCRKQTTALDDLVRALRAPSVVTDPATVARVMAHLDDTPAPEHRVRWPWLAGGLAFAAAAAVLLLVLRPSSNPDDEFVARGTRAAAVAVTLHALTDARELQRLEAGASVTPATAYVASYRNTGGPAYVMVFAIDSERELHWLYPEFVDTVSDPAAVALPVSHEPRLFEETVVLDKPALGTMQLVVLVSQRLLRVSDLEQLARDQRTIEGLRSRWSDAALSATVVEVRQ